MNNIVYVLIENKDTLQQKDSQIIDRSSLIGAASNARIFDAVVRVLVSKKSITTFSIVKDRKANPSGTPITWPMFNNYAQKYWYNETMKFRFYNTAEEILSIYLDNEKMPVFDYISYDDPLVDMKIGSMVFKTATYTPLGKN